MHCISSPSPRPTKIRIPIWTRKRNSDGPLTVASAPNALSPRSNTSAVPQNAIGVAHALTNDKLPKATRRCPFLWMVSLTAAS